MKKQKVYLDTSVIGGCFDAEFRIWSNGLFKDFQDGLFKPVVSEVTSYEITDAPSHVKEKYSELFNYGVEVLEITEEISHLAEIYLERKILPANYRDDALHIAIAAVYCVDVFVSWNFKHIVHYDKIRLFNEVNIGLYYRPVQIYSPREVTSYGKDD